MYKLFKFTVIIIGVALLPSILFAGASQEEFDKEIDELSLYYEDEDIIYTVSKRKELFMESPSAVYTITSEDIKYSGAKKVTDLFRMVPGVDVADVNSFYSGVQSRGFSFFPYYARQMLVLIDGRTVYSPQINATFWDQLPLFLENIERIEVIKGPNAALYGANAFNGVINIITKNPENTRGGLLSITAGQRESQWYTLRYGGDAGNLTYRVTAGYHETKGFSKVHNRIRKPQITLRGDYKIDETSSLSFHGGYAGGDRELGPQVDPEVTSFYFMAKYVKKFNSRNQLLIQYYHDHRNSAMTPFNLEDKTWEDDIELQFNHEGDQYHLVCGAGYRFDRVKHGFLSGARARQYIKKGPHRLNSSTKHNEIFKVFFNGTLDITDSLKLTTALMIENNGFVGTYYSPKGSLVYLPNDNHSFRLSASRAYRTPSFIEEKADFSLPFPLPPFHIGQIGDSSISPERITAYELGYRAKLFGRKLTLNIEAFYHNIRDIIIYREYTRNVFRYENYKDNHVRGIEAWFIWNVKKWWRLTMAYTYQRASDSYLKGLVIEQKAAMGNRFYLPKGIVANIQLYFVDRFHFEKEPWVKPSTVKDYTRLDIRLSKTFCNDRIEAAIIGQNLLDPRHYEYPQTLSSGEANRTVFFELSYRFGG